MSIHKCVWLKRIQFDLAELQPRQNVVFNRVAGILVIHTRFLPSSVRKKYYELDIKIFFII